MFRTSILALCLVVLGSTSASAAGLLDPHIGSLIAEQPLAPVRLLDCKAAYSPLTGQSWSYPSFASVSAPVKSVSIRFALLGLDRRVLEESTVLFNGKYSPGVTIAPRNAIFLSRSYSDGTGLCSVSGVEMADGTRWMADGSDRPWNPIQDVLWGDEPK